MLLTSKQFKQMNHLKREKDVYIYDGMANNEERQKLKEMDDFHYDAYGKHLISNYEDLK